MNADPKQVQKLVNWLETHKYQLITDEDSQPLIQQLADNFTFQELEQAQREILKIMKAKQQRHRRISLVLNLILVLCLILLLANLFGQIFQK